MSTRPAGAGEDGEWEQQTTRKQRKQKAKEGAGAAAAAGPEAASASASSAAATPASAAAANVSGADGDAGSPALRAAQGSSFPLDASATGADDDSVMFGDFMQAGCIGLDGKQIPPGASLMPLPPPQPAAAPAPAQPAAAAASSKGGRRPRYQFDASQLPTCFVCQTRHDIGECRRKDKF